MPDIEARTIKRLLSMARPLKKEIEHLLLVGSEQGLGSAALQNLRGLMEHTKSLSGDEFLDSIQPQDIEALPEDAKAQTALLSLVQFIGYLEGMLEEIEGPEPEPGGCGYSGYYGSGAVQDAARSAVEGAERAAEAVHRAIGGEEGRRIAESIRDAIENAIGGITPKPPSSKGVGNEDFHEDADR